jgi:hypothetical protein
MYGSLESGAVSSRGGLPDLTKGHWMIATSLVALFLLLPAAPAPPVAPDVTALPCGADALAPRFAMVDGTLALTWIEPVAGDDPPSMRIRFARFTGDRWGAARTVHAGRDIWSNWADFPALIESSDGSLVLSWLRRAGPQTYAYHIDLARSRDGGLTWSSIGTLHDDVTPTEHGFVSLVREDDHVRAFWLDGRAMAPTDGDDDDDDDGSGDMALRTAAIGATIGPGEVLDARVCECCNTAATMTALGPVVIYRDRSDEEVRDISIVRRVDGRWTAPARIHRDDWKMAACPVNGPSIVADGLEVIAAWYTWAGTDGAVRVAFSRDAGATFGAPAEIDTTMPLGRVDLLGDGPGSAIICWLDAGAGEGRIMVRRVTADGRVGEQVPVARVDLGRSTGFPRMARHGDDLLIAWTEEGSPGGVVATAIAIADVPAPRAMPARDEP